MDRRSGNRRIKTLTEGFDTNNDLDPSGSYAIPQCDVPYSLTREFAMTMSPAREALAL